MRRGVSLGTSVLVLGSGQRGLANVVASRSVGAGLVITTGLAVDRHKLDLALELGADAVIDVESESTVDRVLELTGGRGVDVVVDTTPRATAPISDALDVLRPGGRIVLAGIKSRLMDGVPVDKVVARAGHHHRCDEPEHRRQRGGGQAGRGGGGPAAQDADPRGRLRRTALRDRPADQQGAR
ncbi:zinc-binding dehydrogenase [Modestobacter excelsi]|uniref:zinc-binding dehydrogenase n=1 Tax=Modestobacter excelsi TaxID=2213161 RepID=UPI00110D1457|nr:zinc-binding dehydrogenase [Modestobacter excelsi]